MPRFPSPERILLINTKYLGDLIVSTPALRAVRNGFPGARISLLVREEYASVMKGSGLIDEVIGFDFGIKKMKGIARLKKEIEFVRLLRSRGFDAAASFQAGDRYAEWLFLSGAERRIGPLKQSFSFLLTDKVAVYEDSISYLEYYLRIATAFGIGDSGRRTEFPVEPGGMIWYKNFASSAGIGEKEKFAVIHPGASEPTKIWPQHNFAELIRRLREKEGIRTVVALGPAELKNGSGKLFTDAGALLADTSESVHNLGALISHARLFVSNDSGARHIAAALDIPSITLMPEDNVTAWKFYGDLSSQHFITGKRNLGAKPVPFLDGIEPAAVFESAARILNHE